ncbi:MAG TPA: energy transducer TonB [Candidatus Acidoferrum sp.]|nr:energy transducer TonB [Candidatus Acidoferrum sp.]
MIPRILVPIDARPPAAADAATQRRRPTTMDERTLVPAMLPIISLNGHSTIPTNLPLESIAARVVVPRDINREAYNVQEDHSTPLQPTEMDERIAVPVGAAPPELIEPLLNVPSDLVNPDVFMTGEVQLIARELTKEQTKSEIVTRFSSIAFHILLISAILILPKIFPPHVPTQEEIDLGQRQVAVLLPPGALEALKPSTRPVQPVPKVHVDPRVLREVAPPVLPAPAPAPERPVKELPSAPIPKLNAVPPEPSPSAPAPKIDTPKPALKLETPDAPQPQRGLILPKNSTPRSLQDTIRDATRNPNAGGRAGAVIGPMPRSGGAPGGGAGGSQGGSGTYGNGYEILTPTEGVDFSDYMARVLAAVRRNWYAVMPESAMLGDRGRVALQFRIMKDGTVPTGEPTRLIGSGKEPLDRAAVSAIRSSNPFEPLPPAFSGPYIELRFYFLYNLPIEAAYQ